MRNHFFYNISFFLACFSIVFAGCQQGNDNWTHFRGSRLDGIADVTSVPVRWTPDSNITWRTEIHGRGWSSPVVYGNQVWVTTALADGKEMYAVCLDFKTGRIIYDIRLFTPDSIFNKHSINTYATPTPCIEKDFVYMHFGRYGTACINTNDGSIAWRRTDLQWLDIQGPGSSPILYKNLLILHCEGTDVQYIIALDKSNGEVVWKTERPKDLYERLEPIGRKAYITPLIIHVKGRDLLISNGSAVCIAYDPETGKEVWRIVGGEDSTISMPFSEVGVVYFHTSFFTTREDEKYAELLAVNPDGEGDIKETNILWKIKTPILQLLTPVIKDGLIYTIDSEGLLMCIDASTGDEVWSHKLKGKYNSSPIYAAGNIYFNSIRGETIVIKEGRKFEIIAQNQLDGEIWATMAVLRNSIVIRTSKYLYRIGN